MTKLRLSRRNWDTYETKNERLANIKEIYEHSTERWWELFDASHLVYYENGNLM